MRKLLIGLLLIGLVASVAVWQRHKILVPLGTSGEPIPHVADALPVPGGVPFGSGEGGEPSHFTVVQLDEFTYAIAEPYSWARNVNYLLLGSERALLFDAGVGHYDIRPVVNSLTDLPLTFMPSHFHYDHTGQGEWNKVAMVDLPHVRERADGNRLQFTWGEHLGSSEAIELPEYDVAEWVKPNSSIELGDRRLVLLYTPGHTDNSVSLFDMERELMFTGDFFSSSGSLSAWLPTARLGDYLQSADRVLARTADMQNVIFRGAHAAVDNSVPHNTRPELKTFRDQLVAIRDGTLDGESGYPVVYQIQENMVLNTEPRFLQNWSTSYPDDFFD